MECLLAYIEISQYQEYILGLMNFSVDKERFTQMKLSSNLPMSSIIEGGKNEDNGDMLYGIKSRGYKLYEKYIEIGSEFEINISWDQRQPLIDIFEDKNKLLNDTNIDIQDIFYLFEIAKEEMVSLLNFSFSRYEQQVEYQKIILLFMPAH